MAAKIPVLLTPPQIQALIGACADADSVSDDGPDPHRAARARAVAALVAASRGKG